MYKVCADINDVEYRPVMLDDDFKLNADKLLSACDAKTKLIWICSPNNPTGNSLEHDEINKVLNAFQGIVIIDEAYSDFSRNKTFRNKLSAHPNLIVLNTMSKAWGCAAIRLGMAFASKAIIEVFNKVKYPYNINLLTQEKALEFLKDPYETDRQVRIILTERTRMIDAFRLLPICEKVFPTDANFFLARMNDAQAIYDYLVDKGIIVRNRTRITLCQNCLRITIGTKTENNELLSALRQYK
jgi:histidinol-phosphate aminotransferase